MTRRDAFQEKTLVAQHLIRLFYVEHFKFAPKLALFAIFIVILSACTKRDPNPESKDPVFAELNKDFGAANADLASINTRVDELQVNLKEAKPQSGERVVYEKRLNEALTAKTYATQKVRMYEVRAEERKIYVQRRYMESLTPHGKKWPDEAEADFELAKLKLMREKNERLRGKNSEVVPRGTTGAEAPSEHAEH